MGECATVWVTTRLCMHKSLCSSSSYATVYTMAPVFSLVLDEDVSADIALTYPELYQELMKVGMSESLVLKA